MYDRVERNDGGKREREREKCRPELAGCVWMIGMDMQIDRHVIVA
jgi:hypothetical protein